MNCVYVCRLIFFFCFDGCIKLKSVAFFGGAFFVVDRCSHYSAVAAWFPLGIVHSLKMLNWLPRSSTQLIAKRRVRVLVAFGFGAVISVFVLNYPLLGNVPIPASPYFLSTVHSDQVSNEEAIHQHWIQPLMYLRFYSPLSFGCLSPTKNNPKRTDWKLDCNSPRYFESMPEWDMWAQYAKKIIIIQSTFIPP